MPVIAGRAGKMILLRPKSFRVGLVLLAVLLVALEHPSGVSAGEVPLGPLSACAHGVKGEVIAVHAKLIKIKDFKYEGDGPATWFHAMKKDQKTVSNAPGTFEAIPNAETQCARFDKKHDTGDIEVPLPSEITTYASFGLFCHKGCANFGSVKIDPGKTYDPVPEGFAPVTACKDTDITAVEGAAVPCTTPVANSAFDTCDAGGGGETTPGNGTAADVAGSMGCIAGGVVAVGLLNARQ